MEFIGQKIQEVFDQSGMTKKAFADKVGMNRNNVYHVFSRKKIDVQLLKRISEALNYDFLQDYVPDDIPVNRQREEIRIVRDQRKSRISLLIELDPDEDILLNEDFCNKLKDLMKIVS